MKSKVLIKRVLNSEEIDKVFEFEIFPLLQKNVANNDSVMIKPNLCGGIRCGTGITTHPILIEKTIKYLKKITNKEIVIAENGGIVVKDNEKIFKRLGIKKLAKKYDIRTIDLSKTDFISKKVKKSYSLENIEISKEVFNFDKIIGIPVLKTHHMAGISVSLKNMVGVMSPRYMRKFHRTDIEKSIVDLNSIRKSDFTIVDGIVGLEGIGPADGDPIQTNVLIAGDDPVAVDSVCTKVMYLDKNIFRFLKYAAETGIGNTDFRKITILGDQLEDIGRSFKLCIDVIKKMVSPTIQINDYNKCNGCGGVVATALMLLLKSRYKFDLKTLKNLKIFIGEKKIKEKNSILLVGDCIGRMNEDCNNIKGCPPSISEVIKRIKSD